MIPAFYDNCEIFVTGGTGALGKSLLEKLLRSCNVDRIYILLRSKGTLNLEQRLQKLCNAKIFRVLKSTKPDALNKLVPIAGDAMKKGLDISEDDVKLMENVSVVFHCAATVRFDEELTTSLRLNVAGTLEVLKLAESFKNLKLFMHVSTFFSNPYLNYVEPKVYTSPLSWRTCLKLLENNNSSEELSYITKKVITGFPNTYTFTKNIAESLVDEWRYRLPIAIFRPSVVLASIEEPEPGFPPSLMGAIGLFVISGAGILNCISMAKNERLDMTALDNCTKTMLYYGVKASEIYKTSVPDTTPVYATSSSKHLPYAFSAFLEVVNDFGLQTCVYEKQFMLPHLSVIDNRLEYRILVILKQVVPAFLGDGLLRLFGYKPALLSAIRKAYVTLEVLQPFVFNTWDSPGVTDYEQMVEDTKGTEFDVSNNTIVAYDVENLRIMMIRLMYKAREVLLNEDISTLPRSRKILKIKRFIYDLLCFYLFVYIFRKVYQIIFNYV
ncbi:fatty acyl-CoA reductase 1-like [Teleopsis dalmanni]|uniref:fatty acyl-CoA reductase 1-like n=1 Tax=Teleopsis dalmanni TaxID=139649 RepID=UPI0018CE3156|nr:fatty acyl-CoA reductase 1-like [Teleopsis dalmanni]